MFETQMKTLAGTPVYQEIQKSANIHLKKWLANGIEEVQVLKECNWKVDDAVFFNHKKDRAYLLLLIQDKAADAKLDYVYVMYGALEKQQWNIYFLSLPSLVFPRAQLTKNEHTPVSLEVLSELARAEVLKGYYTGNGQINDNYVEKAYTAELRRRNEKF